MQRQSYYYSGLMLLVVWKVFLPMKKTVTSSSSSTLAIRALHCTSLRSVAAISGYQLPPLPSSSHECIRFSTKVLLQQL
jgi:hypothetical protein